MRRIARGVVVVAALAACGCQSIHAPWVRTATDRPERPLDQPEIRTARDAVPDKIMLGDRARGGYADSPAGP